jgi:hypothetical protein
MSARRSQLRSQYLRRRVGSVDGRNRQRLQRGIHLANPIVELSGASYHRHVLQAHDEQIQLRVERRDDVIELPLACDLTIERSPMPILNFRVAVNVLFFVRQIFRRPIVQSLNHIGGLDFGTEVRF